MTRLPRGAFSLMVRWWMPFLLTACGGSPTTPSRETQPDSTTNEPPDTTMNEPSDSTMNEPPDSVENPGPADTTFVRGLLPYDRASPVIYVNDDIVDTYTDEYLMALASAGEIDLRAIVTQSSVQPYNPYIPDAWVDATHQLRVEVVALARSSGFTNLPDPVEGSRGHLVEPASGVIDETIKLGGAVTELIVGEARQADPEHPLVLVMGGPLTAAADAYLQDPSIADRVVVAWLGGNTIHMGDYNGWADGWAAYIVLDRMQLFIFPVNQADPEVPKSRIHEELPDTPLRAWMLDKQHPTNGLPGGRDADAPPAVALMEPNYVSSIERVSFGRWLETDGHRVPVFEVDPEGGAILVTESDRALATAEWWRAMTNPAGYE